MTRAFIRLRDDRRGATIVEFAFVLPVMLAIIMGLMDLTYQAYVQSVLTGVVQKAGRDGTIQSNASDAAGSSLDQKVMQQVWSIAKGATWQSSRKSYAKFGNITAEPFRDNNGDGVFDPSTECFTDLNGNGSRDLDPGVAGQGGANDVVVYTMTVQFDRMFPLAWLIGWTQRPSISATTILKNQPYSTQTSAGPKLVCPA